MKMILLLIVVSILNVGAFAKKVKINYSKIPVPKIGYQELIKEINFPQLTLADNDTKIGRIQRALRWENIVRAVEIRYNIPKNYLLGMICVESEGDPTQPNLSGDGGLGLIHMQPLLATKYGLNLISNSKKLRDFVQGRKIRRIIDMENGDLKNLVKYDDRFHPIKNLDAAARMLCDFKVRFGSWNLALRAFSGRRTYAGKIINYARDIGNKKFMLGVIKDFNNLNENNKISSKKLNFKLYISKFHNLNRNYGLDQYKKLRKYKI
mgnify:CR=1 FL=1